MSEKIPYSSPFGKFVKYSSVVFMSGHRDALPSVDNERRFMAMPKEVADAHVEFNAALYKYIVADTFAVKILMRGITDKEHIAHLHHLLDTDPMTAAGIFDRKPALPRMTVIAEKVRALWGDV